jgi:fatty acid desaturase
MSGVNYWRGRLAVIAACWRGDLSGYPYIPAAAQRRVIASVRWMSVFMVAMVGGSAVLFGWRAPLLYYVLPQLLGQVFLRFYLLTEHTDCELGPNGLLNTRTTLTNRAIRWLMWNMSFHAEHHLYPSIPFHRLPTAHQAVREKLGVVQPGYARWHAGYFRRILGRHVAAELPSPEVI